MSRLSELLKEARTAQRVTVEREPMLREVAEQLGVTWQSVSLWEAGQSLPAVERLERIAEVYGLPVDKVRRAWADSAVEKAGGGE